MITLICGKCLMLGWKYISRFSDSQHHSQFQKKKMIFLLLKYIKFFNKNEIIFYFISWKMSTKFFYSVWDKFTPTFGVDYMAKINFMSQAKKFHFQLYFTRKLFIYICPHKKIQSINFQFCFIFFSMLLKLTWWSKELSTMVEISA